MRDSVQLSAFEKGDHQVIEMFNGGDELIIGFPFNRTMIMINRIGDKLSLNCDLGHYHSDICGIGAIDVTQRDYSIAITYNHEFLMRARPYDYSCRIKQFVESRDIDIDPLGPVSPGKIFGEKWQSQVYIHFTKPIVEKIANLEFSIFRSDDLHEGLFLSDDMEDFKLDEPRFTLCASLQLRKRPYYFLFVEWTYYDQWSYHGNIYYNNSVFPHDNT